MNIFRKLATSVFVIILLAGIPVMTNAEVMLMVQETDLEMGIMPAANFTVDDWFSSPNMFTVTLVNSGTVPLKTAIVGMTLTSSSFGEVMRGYLTVVGDGSQINTSYIPNWPAGIAPVRDGFIGTLAPGGSYMINNTMLKNDTPQMSGGSWSDAFEDEVLKIGYLPEGKYTLRFVLYGYDQNNDPLEGSLIEEKSFSISNPLPPELVSPDDDSDDAVSIPRFSWQRPKVSDFREFSKNVDINYDIYVWKMFSETGQTLTEEDAIVRIPIWSVKKYNQEMITFDPGQAREELIPGRKYCWQVQAYDGVGRPISLKNQGKSDVWSFTIQFKAPTINEPLSFSPLSFSWTPAQGGGSVIQYRVRIANNSEFSGGYKQDGIVMTSFTYPDDAQPLKYGVLYYLELQATDDSGMPIGTPDRTVFTLPSVEINLASPEDNSVSPTDTPSFNWQGNAKYFVVHIYDEAGTWSYTSSAIEDKRWVYDGEDLKHGITYAWNVTPSTRNGEVAGDASETWRFRLAADDQMSLLSPIDSQVETLFPVFTWKEISGVAGAGQTTYNIVITDDTGAAVHTASVSSTTYTYPQDATPLKSASRYSWSVNAEKNGVEVGLRSTQASFSTPLPAAGTEEVTMEDLSRAVKAVLEKFPQLAEFKNKNLISITDANGPMSVSQFLEVFGTYKIIDAKVK